MTDLDWLLGGSATLLLIVAVYQWRRAEHWKRAARRLWRGAMRVR